MSRKAEILARIAKGEISDALFNELKQIKATEDQAVAERKNQIANVIRSIESSKITFAELMESNLFKSGDLIAYAQEKGIKFSGKTGGAGGTKTKRDKGLVLFQFPKGIRGAAAEIGTKTPRLNLTKSMKDLVAKGGDLKANLLALAVKTPEAQQFLGTAQGLSLVDAWVNHMKSQAGK